MLIKWIFQCSVWYWYAALIPEVHAGFLYLTKPLHSPPFFELDSHDNISKWPWRIIVHGLQTCEVLHQLQRKHPVQNVIHEGRICHLLPHWFMIGQLVFPKREHLDVNSESGDSAGLDLWISARCCRKSIFYTLHVALTLSPAGWCSQSTPHDESTMCCHELPHILWVFL